MVLIAESGSTKCDWRIYDDQGHRQETFRSIGLNPNFLSTVEIKDTIKQIPGLSKYQDFVQQIHFFGAGCSDEQANLYIENAIKSLFKQADVSIGHDLRAAAYACYQGEPAICCILGTGSNSCFFDGENIREEVPSLGFIMGDEAGGVYFGKKLITAYFYKQLPKDIHEDFVYKYPMLDFTTMKEKVYRNNRPNSFLASFMPFVVKHRKQPYIQNWIKEGIDLFIKNHIQCFPEVNSVSIHFVGSVAKVLRDELSEALIEKDLRLGQIIQEPAQALSEYIFRSRKD